MFQYAFARAYAKMTNSILHTNSWVGQKIFGIRDEPIKQQFKKMPLDVIPGGETNIELFGYFQNAASLKIMNRRDLKEWFRIHQQWHKYIEQPETTAHIRHGDYLTLTDIYCVVTKESYIKAITRSGCSGVKWISEETAAPNDLPNDIKFLKDFISIMYSRNIFRANSSFSWWAATLSNARVFSPLVEARTGINNVEFVEGNWPRLVDQSHVTGGSIVSDLHLS